MPLLPATQPLDLRHLTQQFAQAGRITQILLRPARAAPMRVVDSAQALAGRGLLGDRTGDKPASRVGVGNAGVGSGGVGSGGAGGGKRQITLLQAEHLPVIQALCGLPALPAALLRRNLVVSGINLLAARSLFKDTPLLLQLGAADDPAAVLLQITGPCEPCSKMEAALGPGGYNAMRGHGGVTARVLRGGWLRVGATVSCVAANRATGQIDGGQP